MTRPSWESTVMGLGFLALVGFALWLAVNHNFTAIWSGVGSIVGVVTGSIPSYFFHQQAQRAGEEARTASARVAALHAFVPDDKKADAEAAVARATQ